MAELTVIEVLRRLDEPAEPQPEFAQALLTSCLDELEGTTTEAPGRERAPELIRVPIRERLRPTARRRRREPFWSGPDRRWLRVAVAAAVAIAWIVGAVLVRVPIGGGSALVAMRQAEARFAHLPPFHATVVKRTPGAWIAASFGDPIGSVPDAVVTRDLAYLDGTHFRNEVTDATSLPPAIATQYGVPGPGEFWAADGEYFAEYVPSVDALNVGPVDGERALASFAAGEFDPTWGENDAFFRDHCELLDDTTMLERVVQHVHCTDAAFHQYDGGPPLDVDLFVDVQTGMLLRAQSRNEGTWFEVTSIAFDPGYQASDFAIVVPEDASVSWTGGGTPPDRFRQPLDAAVTAIPVGNRPERVVAGAGSIWVYYTEGGTGDVADGGRATIARIDPATNEVVATIPIPTGLTEVPKGWSSPLNFVHDIEVTDDGVFVSYRDAGDAPPVHVARIDLETNTLGPPLMTFDRRADGLTGVSFATFDGSLWISDAQGGREVTFPGEKRPWPFAALLRVDPATGDVLQRIPIDGNAGFPIAGGRYLWMIGYTSDDQGPTTGMQLFRVDPSTGEAATMKLPNASLSIAYGDDALWVRTGSYRRTAHVLRVDPVALQVDATIEVGHDEGGITTGEGLVWVTNAMDNTLMAIDPTTNRVVRTVNVGATPLGVVTTDGAVWTANWRDTAVSRVDLPTLG